MKPKPMVEIGGKPVLWHIMKHYSVYGLNEFVIALGYKGDVIKKYIVDYCHLSSDLAVNLRTGDVKANGSRPSWFVELIDTGQATMTGGRIKRLQPHLGNQTFMLTWGDGVSNVNLAELLEYHRSHGKLVTMTAVRPPARFGHIEVDDGGQVKVFSEKPQTAEGWINGAFFVLEPGIFDYIEDDMTAWERAPMEALARDGQLMAYTHTSFWQCMDTLRDKVLLEELWQTGKAPWKIWKD